jgi:signal transduction histidine kinase
VIARLSASYLAIFLIVLVALSAIAYIFVGHVYASEVQPALDLPETQDALRAAMRKVLLVILAVDAPLLALVGLASYMLARLSVAPLVEARKREVQFAADAAHELRTPLARIASVAQAANPERENEALNSITRTALDASALVGDLLTLLRNEELAVRSSEPVDLGTILLATARDYVSNAAQRKVEIEVRAQSAIVNGEAIRLRQLAANLIDNAVRHAHTRVRAWTENDGEWAKLLVEDDGDGIPLELRERVFERFFKVREDAGGSGLGLAICRWVAHAHGGEIQVVEHARFVARIPLLRSL